jgi:hypothetical protein
MDLSPLAKRYATKSSGRYSTDITDALDATGTGCCFEHYVEFERRHPEGTNPGAP